VEIARDSLRLEAQHARVLAVTDYSRTVGPGWLAPLVQSDLPVEVSLHIYPLDSAEMVRALSFKLVQLQSSRLAQLREERLADPEREVQSKTPRGYATAWRAGRSASSASGCTC
jgi:hypothetical protein